ncbi:Uncharacterised protein [uncultured archaeon]|nr:Uncharacterised protein [uncultured archaeon]
MASSVIDSRTITATTPNTSRAVQGTNIYDVPKVKDANLYFNSSFVKNQNSFGLRKKTGTEVVCPRCGWVWR